MPQEILINTKQLVITPNQNCNLRCKHCYVKDFQKNYIDSASLLLFLNKAVTHNITNFYWVGGEVFLYPDFCQIVDMFPNITHTIQTNGTILPKFKKYDNLSFQISIDGMESAHDLNRGRGTFAKSINFLKFVNDSGSKVVTRTLMFPQAKESFDQFEQLTKSIDPSIECWKITPWEADGAKPEKILELVMSINNKGVHNCCECFAKIGELDEEIPILLERLKSSIHLCKRCAFYSKCVESKTGN